jgi:hypothetical protein
MASRWLTGFRIWYISRPMPTTARPEHVISRTPAVSCAREASPSTNAWIIELPTMAVTIWTTKRTPTVTAIILRDMTLLTRASEHLLRS